MDPLRWQRLEALFLAAAQLPADERAVFVARETAGDPALAHVLTGMLGSTEGAGPRIAAIVESAAASLAPRDAWTGRRFGPYRVTREIGRGGMGLVFEAVRDDDEYRKRVAIKAAPWWRDTAAVRERFRLERQILAELEHPHIARFLDGGTDGGIPYFVMEYVEGRPITTYCEESRLDLRRRLEIFRLVCHAVHTAHERLIVHRDLKPANILVDGSGAPKLLDFGIAKLLDPAADPGVTAGDPVWTPDYTSPEQVRGRPVTVRTDVYSLGLILYELLAGERGQVADQSSPLALHRSICDVEPSAPSVRAAARGDRELARHLRGDLDAIAMTAIRKEPERRYGSAAALADDVGRYLNARPVQARASTAAYRAGKFLRRHALGAAAAALVVASVVAGTVSTVYQARRAERRFEQVRALANTFVFDVHDQIAPLAGSTAARKAIVSTALTYLENLRTEAGGDAALARELAAAYEKVGTVQGQPLSANLGDTAGAVASYGRAVDLLEPLAAGGDRQATQQLASVTRRLATVQQAQGAMDAALAGFEKARVLGERLVSSAPDDRDALALVSQVSSDVARVAFQRRDLALAERAGLRAVETARRLVALEPRSTDHRETLATSLNALGVARMLAGRLEEAAQSFQASVEAREQMAADDPTNAARRRTLMISYGNLGDVLGYRTENLGDRPGAVAAFTRAIALAERAKESDAADRRAQFDVANARLRLGSVLAEDAATIERGIEELRTAQRVINTLLASEPASDRYGYLALVIGGQLGGALTNANRFDEAARVLEAVLAAGPAFLNGTNRPGARSTMVEATLNLARIRARTGDATVSVLVESVAKELSGATLGTPIADATAHGDLARVYLDMARSTPRRTETLAQLALASLEKSAALWRAATLPGAVAPRRIEALASLDAAVATARKLVAGR